MKRLGQTGLILLLIFLGIEIVQLTPEDLKWGREPTVNSSPPVREEKEIRESLTEIYMTETHYDGRGWELWAHKSFRYWGEDELHLEDIKGAFPASQGVSFVVTGQVGIIDMNTMDMEINGDVVTQSSNGYTFKAGLILYSSHHHRLEGPSPIEVILPNDKERDVPVVIKGSEMVADLTTALVEIHGDVVMEQPFGKDKKLMVQSEKATFSGQSNLAQFFKNVVISMAPMKITGSEAQFEYEKEMGSISSVKVKGKVRAYDADKWITSKQVEIHLKEEKFVFKGNPRVVQGEDELRGEEIVLRDGGQFVQIRKARVKVDAENGEGER